MRFLFLFPCLLLAIGWLPGAAFGACGEGDVGDIDMSCNGLWLERNRVYADNGFCFQSPRGIKAFGARCYPPYGRLSANNTCYVRAIEKLERDRGCVP